MEVGDLVILYSGHSSVSHIWLTPAAIVDNKFGRFHHNDFLGKPFGSRIASRGNSDGWLLALQPTPELWASAQSTRTQIVNNTDASVIAFNLDLHPGSVVVESGTGSGCMTLAIANCVGSLLKEGDVLSHAYARLFFLHYPFSERSYILLPLRIMNTSFSNFTAPNGHVHTYEYNNSRAEAARNEFTKMGLSEIISVHHAGNNIRWDQSKTQLSVLFYLSRCFSRRLRTAIWRRWISVDTSAFC